MPQSRRELLDALSRIQFGPYGTFFELTGNGTHAWRVYKLARQKHLPVPDWVLTYLDGCAERITAAGGTGSPKLIAKALKIDTRRGGRTARARAKADLRDLTIVDRVLARRKLATKGKRRHIDDLVFGELADKFGLETAGQRGAGGGVA